MAIVVLDANIWIKERLLRSGMGAALLWAVRKTEGFLLLPDTTRFEIVNGVKKEIIKSTAEIEKNLEQRKRGQALNVDKSIPNEVIEIEQENVPVQGLTPSFAFVKGLTPSFVRVPSGFDYFRPSAPVSPLSPQRRFHRHSGVSPSPPFANPRT